MPDSGCVVFANRYANGTNSGRESDLYYVKLDKLGNIVDPLPVAVNESALINENEILLYPSPAKDVLYVKHHFANTEKLNLKIYDLAGQLVLAQKIDREPIQVKHLSKGMYNCILTQNQKIIHSNKLLK